MLKSIYKNVSTLSVKTVLCICIGNIAIPVFLEHAYGESWDYQAGRTANLSYDLVRQLINSGITDEY
ncbi:MAG: hypothetical protein JNL11_03535 [Bdellovibrionaceae bacterium]|nr:hypothetical protein [Pseudobdellovibrionaceae bacterium]